MIEKDDSYIDVSQYFPHNVTAGITTRRGGFSSGPYDSFNLGFHVQDNALAVDKNRKKLRDDLGCKRVLWINQVHGSRVVKGGIRKGHTIPEADAVYTNLTGEACVVITADCAPVLLSNKMGTEVAAVHAGWKGLCNGVVGNSVAAFSCNTSELVAYLAPCISQEHYQVDGYVYGRFMAFDPDMAAFFKADIPEHFLLDLKGAVRMALQKAGVKDVFSDDRCAFRNKELFYSHRRDGGVTGRFASFIAIK